MLMKLTNSVRTCKTIAAFVDLLRFRSDQNQRRSSSWIQRPKKQSNFLSYRGWLHCSRRSQINNGLELKNLRKNGNNNIETSILGKLKITI
jgi:hypothetical protein